MRKCPALLISAPASNQGKTTITAGLARAHRRRGRKVRIFKTGPDFIDPMILERASGAPVYQLDLWMNGEDDCRRLLYDAAADNDVILIEGVMGLFDGNPSSADLAELFGIPVVTIIDSGGMAQTFGAIAQGLKEFRSSLICAGVLANKVASTKHAKMIEDGVRASVHYLGAVFRNDEYALPSRHLGLVQASEIADLEYKLNLAADAIELTDIEKVLQEVEFYPSPSVDPPKLLEGVTIAIAKDGAFSFLYEANLQLLKSMGARLIFFSPLLDKCLPNADSVYLPGGYPELYVGQLEKNVSMKKALSEHFESGRSIYAECGGMLYLLDSLEDKAGNVGAMLGLLPGRAVMQERLESLGYQSAEFSEGTLRGHTFHYSSLHVEASPVGHGKRHQNSSPGEPIYKQRGLVASYLHLYFPSNPASAAGLFFARS